MVAVVDSKTRQNLWMVVGGCPQLRRWRRPLEEIRRISD
jgi:hypothetical protein